MAKKKPITPLVWNPKTCNHADSQNTNSGFHRFWQCNDCGLTKTEGFISHDTASQFCAQLPTSEQRHEFIAEYEREFPDSEIEAKAKIVFSRLELRLKKSPLLDVGLTKAKIKAQAELLVDYTKANREKFLNGWEDEHGKKARNELQHKLDMEIKKRDFEIKQRLYGQEA